MSSLLPGPRQHDSALGPPAGSAHSFRWRLNRAGIINVWFYFDQRFTLSGGRLVLRGSNGSGKSRALEMLLPFVLDADRRRMDATGSGKVRLEDLMRAGGDGQTNRLGYVWLELARDLEDPDADGQRTEFLTVGALIRFSHSTSEAMAWYFLTSLRVDEELQLLDTSRVPLSKEGLAAIIGADRLTSSPDLHRDRVRAAVFGLHGDQGRERYAGLLQLLHTLRSPDVGNRIDEGRLPQILSDALPPLSDKAIATAGDELDGLEETRAALDRLETAYGHVADFLRVYTRYATGVCLTAGERTQAAAVLARDTDATAAQKEEAHLQFVHDHAEAVARVGELEGYRDELEATVAGIRQSSEYKAARELNERLNTLKALEGAARNALAGAAGARAEELRTADACGEAGLDTAAAVAEMADVAAEARRLLDEARLNVPLPKTPHVEVVASEVDVEPVRTTVDADPEPVPRPSAVRLAPSPEEITMAVEAFVAATPAVLSAAKSRAQQAAARAAEAEELTSLLKTLHRAQDRAEDAAEDAATAEGRAAHAETERDEAAVQLAMEWRGWTASSDVQRLLGIIDWSSTAVAALLDDVEALVGEGVGSKAEQELARLDTLAQQAAAPARARHAQEVAALEAQARQDTARREELLAEAEELRQERDLPPAKPDWLDNPPNGAPALWELLDFRPEVDARARAGIEGALLASGLLHGVLTQDGDIVVGEGQLLLSTGGPAALRSLRTVLAPSCSNVAEAARVMTVLDQVALGPGHPTWVSTDGAWGNGPLTGRHLPSAARYIGAAARAAARAARLTEIDRLLRELHQAAQARSEKQDALETWLRELEDHLVQAPRSVQLATLRVRVTAARADAIASHRQAGALAEEAERLQRAWTARHLRHREVCTALGMPDDAEGLRSTQISAQQAQTPCQNLQRAGEAVGRHLARWQRLAGRLDEVRKARGAAERDAEAASLAWSREASELAALRESLGSSPQKVHELLDAAERELKQTKSSLQRANADVLALTSKVATAKEKAHGAQETAREARQALGAQAQALYRRLRHPALAVALEPGTIAPPALLSASSSADDILTAVREVKAAVRRPESTADATALVRAQSVLERNTTGAYDVTVTVEDDLHVVELTDASGRRHVADAAADLRERRDRGRSALTERERTAFSAFVLGGMAEELRTRIQEAERLVKAMNESLLPIKTSHGIGVQVRWRLADSANEHVMRIKDLMQRDVRVLRDEESDELITRLKALVDVAYSNDPQAGYAAHLRTALDYRTWHVVEAYITGPGPKQERKISRRAKLSQGETRFVSYVTLFAAADAYLSGLPDTGRALRLILLDDAFAKVDHRTIGELMALLVRMDLDFVMTGHALWGFFEAVPALDTYEVRRAEGTAAVTTHVHWDGHTRHLRAAS